MPIYRGSQKVTPRRAGVDLARVYRGSHLVWEAVITVTPQAPTFHNAAPWVTLPDQEGVTYSVSGTPGYNASVTVTATAQPGYELVGTATWSHTFGPPPRYTASNSGSYGQVGTVSWLTITTHAVTGDGPASGTWAVTWSSSHLSYGLRALVDGAVVADTGYGSISNANQSVTIPERQYSSGEVITFQARAGSLSTSVNAWSWSLS